MQRLISAYKLWQEFLPNFQKTSRYTLGEKIDNLFIETFELIITSSFSPPQQKIIFIQKTSNKIDVLKFLLQISWEIKSLNNKKYIILSKHLNEIGKMIGGLIKQL